MTAANVLSSCGAWVLAGTLLAAASTHAQPQPPSSKWQDLDRRAQELYESAALADAIAAARVALAAATSPAERAESLGRLGAYLQYNAENDEAERLLRESLRLREELFGPESLEFAQGAYDLAIFARDAGQRAEALMLAERALAIRERLPASDTRLAEALDALGSILGALGRHAEALPPFERAMALHEAVPPVRRAMAEYGVLCVNLAGSYQRLGKFQQADLTLTKGREALRIRPGTSHITYVASTLVLASLKSDLARYQEAESLFAEGLGLIGKSHPYYSSSLNNRAVMYRSMGNAERAEADLTESIALRSASLGPSHITLIPSKGNLAKLVYARDRVSGERMLRELATTLASGNALAFEHVNVLIGLAAAERDRRAYDDAQATLQRALALTLKELGARHPLHAVIVRDIGLTREMAGDLAGAGVALTEAWRLAEDTHGQTHPAMLPIGRGLARVAEARGDVAEAVDLYRRNFETEDRFLNDVFSVGSESFKEAVLASLTDPVDELIGFQARHGDASPAARVLAFEAATRRKGRVLEHVRHERQSVRASVTDATEPLLEQRAAITRCRTSLMLALGDRTMAPTVVGGCGLEGTELAGKYERLLSDVRGRWSDTVATEAARAVAVLEEQEQRLDAAIARTGGALAFTTEKIGVAAVAGRLEDDELLLEFAAYVVTGSRTPGAPVSAKRYGAFVLDAQGKVEWIDLGDAAPIDSAIADLLRAANDWAVSTRNREGRSALASEATAVDAMKEIGARVWVPVAPRMPSGIRKLRVAPDSALHLVPFEAIPAGPAATLIDRYVVTYLPAGRDLARPAPPMPHTSAVVMASIGRGAGASSRAAARWQLQRLPGAGAEAREVTTLLGAQLKTGAGASEQFVKSLRSPQILHLAGHGRVDDDGCLGPPCESARASAGKAMALSVVVFEEAYAPVAGSADDGLLTATELQEVDLRGTAMLVLSQCQMASGLTSVGEGVYGMRRAAVVAGVKTFVAPLWNVDDRVQRTLMREFYKALSTGRGRGAALRDAKLAISRAAATRSFLYWAPVILTGDSGPIALSR